MRVFHRYILRNLLIATGFVSVVLSVVIFLTQSLRFLELVINAGASSGTFWILTVLVLPRFFEIIVPLAATVATVFVYNKMNADSEIVVAKSVGFSMTSLARPVVVMALILTVFLWSVSMWLAPVSLSSLQSMREIIKAQVSHYLIHEGVFNRVGDGYTVYVRERSNDGTLQGVMIHDSRETKNEPVTVFAKSGAIVLNDGVSQVVVYDGTRQQYNPDTRSIDRLNFERYTLDLPDNGPVRNRWQEPDERTIFELLTPDMSVARNQEAVRDFRIEIHKRFVGPLLALVFPLLTCAIMIRGGQSRRGQGPRIALAMASVVVIQGGMIAAFNLARHSDAGLALAYALVLIPLIVATAMLKPQGGAIERRSDEAALKGGVS